MKRISGRGR
uniref:Uncharacterized protein n=1 Tax=Arundo donax TaxID=35708 RepID=A0A0A9U115_ARUDO